MLLKCRPKRHLLLNPNFRVMVAAHPAYLEATTCKKSLTVKKEDMKFCAINVQANAFSRLVVIVEIEGVKGTVYIDTCAKMRVASYSLYLALVKCG